jgi:two-component system chemotaxis response regulator CheB
MSRPSIDVLLESAAWAFGERLLAIVLSGANTDGAAGLRAVHEAGGVCWAQHPDEALALTMPAAAIKAVPAARVLRLAEMAAALEELVKP